MEHDALDVLTDALVATRYPYEVREILDRIEDRDELCKVVGAALARSMNKGHRDGVEAERDRIRRSLGL